MQVNLVEIAENIKSYVSGIKIPFDTSKIQFKIKDNKIIISNEEYLVKYELVDYEYNVPLKCDTFAFFNDSWPIYYCPPILTDSKTQFKRGYFGHGSIDIEYFSNDPDASKMMIVSVYLL